LLSILFGDCEVAFGSTLHKEVRMAGRASPPAPTPLATNPSPNVIPCHRAVRSDRSLGGFQGGLPMKRALLEQEGIGFDTSGRVQVDSFFYS
jgi:O6-methylguanine-DNA--protein-cysteine methyltransferase